MVIRPTKLARKSKIFILHLQCSDGLSFSINILKKYIIGFESPKDILPFLGIIEDYATMFMHPHPNCIEIFRDEYSEGENFSENFLNFRANHHISIEKNNELYGLIINHIRSLIIKHNDMNNIIKYLEETINKIKMMKNELLA